MSAFRLLERRDRSALWPAGAAVPAGWTDLTGLTSKAECLARLHGADAAGPTADFSLMFFGGVERDRVAEQYDFLLETAEFADRRGFRALWLPERHFDPFGGLFPNPALLHAAVAVRTTRLRLRAGSVVLPLHHPARVAEEWAVVDQLSRGRVEVSFAPGWNADDFALAAAPFADRYRVLQETIDVVRRLWAGETVQYAHGNGPPADLTTYPRPVQPILPMWTTVAGAERNFAWAGRAGLNVLTHLFDQTIDDLKRKIGTYRAARTEAGLDPRGGRIAVAVHAFVSDDAALVQREAEGGYVRYSCANRGMLARLAAARGGADFRLGEADAEPFARFLFDKFLKGRSLIGSAADCRRVVNDLIAADVQDVTALLDFGPSREAIRATLPALAELATSYAVR